MNKKENDWFLDLLILIPELPGILMLLFGLFYLYWSKKGDDWMYDTGGPGVFTNITWIKNTYGEKAAKGSNLLIAWTLIVLGIVLILIGIWLHIEILTSAK
ncbi:hypothetical protein ACYSNM_13585 [Myroides sp. LJL116]